MPGFYRRYCALVALAHPGQCLPLCGFVFILSGFVLAYVYHSFSAGVIACDYRRFMLARLARIYPLHLFTLVIVLVLEVAAACMGLVYPSVQAHWAPPFTAEQTPLSLLSNLLMLQTLHWGRFGTCPPGP